MKSILFFIPSLGGGGAERVLINLVNNLDPNKYDITVQTIFDVGVNRSYLAENITYCSVFKKQFPGNTRIFKLFSPGHLYQQFIKKRYDMVVSYLEGPAARIVSGCPYEDSKLISWIHVEQHSVQAAAYSFRSAEEAVRCYSKFDQIICVAQTVKEDFESIFSIPVPCQVLYNTNEDETIIAKSKIPLPSNVFSREINLSSVGRLRPEKGYDRLIQAHKKLIDNGLKHHIYIFGNGSEEEKLREQIKSCGVANTFHLMGFQENPYQYIAKTDLFICSSRREGFSTAVTEALILGIPVISTLCSGANELLGSHNEYGVVTENSEDGIYQGLHRVLSDPHLLQHYQKQAQQRGKEFSKNNTVKAVEELLDTL